MMRERARLIANTAYYQGAGGPLSAFEPQPCERLLTLHDLLVKTSDPFYQDRLGTEKKVDFAKTGSG
jgi:hypothetical protein